MSCRVRGSRSSGLGRGLLIAGIVVGGSFVAERALAAADEPTPPVTAAAESIDLEPREIVRLVQQLSDPDFKRRAQAERTLRTIQHPDKLREALAKADLETRVRLERIITLVEQRFRADRLARFLSRTENSELPGWDRFSDIVGDSDAMRAYYVQLWQTEPLLMRSIELPASEFSKALDQRVGEVQGTRPPESPRLEYTFAALFFASGDTRLTQSEVKTDLLAKGIGSRAPFLKLLGTPTEPTTLRKLVARWISHSNGTPLQRLSLAFQLEFPEGIEPARALVAERELAPQIRAYSLLALARFGSREDEAAVATFLDDAGLVHRDEYQGQTWTVQTRDIALAVLWHFAGEDPRKHGFQRLITNPRHVFVTNSLSFPTDELRLEAQQAWKSWVETHPQPVTAKPPTE